MTAQPVAIRGALRDYDWGRPDGLARWSGAKTGGPQAELWYGCHPSAPSPLVDAAGETLADRWSDPPPLLVKLLAAGAPLSLQVHPKADLAARWLQDPEAAELLSDGVEKTELLVAVEPFVVLVGWRPFAESARLLSAIGADESVVAAMAHGDPRAAVRLLLTEHPVREDAAAWARATAAADLDEVAAAAIAAVVKSFDGDPGVAVAAILQSHRLDPYDAVYVPAGVPHAYVAGLGVEVMTASDNVLRMGLTAKRMSVEHTLAAIVPDGRPTVIQAPRDHLYAPAGAPFTVVVAGPQEVSADSGAYRLVLAVEVDADVLIGQHRHSVGEGTALAVPPNAETARVTTPGRAVVVSAAEQVA